MSSTRPLTTTDRKGISMTIAACESALKKATAIPEAIVTNLWQIIADGQNMLIPNEASSEQSQAWIDLAHSTLRAAAAYCVVEFPPDDQEAA